MFLLVRLLGYDFLNASINAKLKALKPRAFANCRDLELVRLPKCLESQVAEAFVGCPKARFEFF